ncbi:MAG: hypothetical protein RL463_719 [Bacteroidota bacterium]|jgi:hypothetical protein
MSNKDNSKFVRAKVKELCSLQMHYILSFPKRENIPVYDWQLDIEYNEDFALWDLEMTR